MTSFILDTVASVAETLLAGQIGAFADNVDRLDLRAFDFASVAAVKAVASDAAFGLRIDVPGEGVIFVNGLTFAQLSGGDMIL
jgi:hypothetical protein